MHSTFVSMTKPELDVSWWQRIKMADWRDSLGQSTGHLYLTILHSRNGFLHTTSTQGILFLQLMEGQTDRWIAPNQ